MTVLRIRFKKLGGHYHCRVFTAHASDQTFAKAGDLVFDEAEFNDVRALMSRAQFLPEDEAQGIAASLPK